MNEAILSLLNQYDTEHLVAAVAAPAVGQMNIYFEASEWWESTEIASVSVKSGSSAQSPDLFSSTPRELN